MYVWLLQRNEPTPTDNDGKERLLRTGIIAGLLADMGHDVLWWTSDFNHYKKVNRHGANHRQVVNDHYEIQYLKSTGYKKNFSIFRVIANKAVASSFAQIAAKERRKPDLVIASLPTAELAWEGLLYARSKGIPFAVDVRDLWPDVIVDMTPKWAQIFVEAGLRSLTKLTKEVFTNADAIIGLTPQFLDWGLAFANRPRTWRDAVVPMGYLVQDHIGPQKFLPSSLKSTATSDRLRVVFAGALGKGSDFEPLLEAVRISEEMDTPIEFFFCGSGDQEYYVRRKLEKLNHAHFLGWLESSELTNLFASCDVGLLPYRDTGNYRKNMPNKPAEYLANGMVVGSSLSDGPLYSLILRYDCGFSYFGSGSVLYDKLLELSLDPGLLLRAKASAKAAFYAELEGGKVYRSAIDHFELLAKAGVK